MSMVVMGGASYPTPAARAWADRATARRVARGYLRRARHPRHPTATLDALDHAPHVDQLDLLLQVRRVEYERATTAALGRGHILEQDPAKSRPAPSVYIPPTIEESDPATFKAQRIPIDSTLLTSEWCTAFLQRLRKLIAERLRAFLAPPRGT